MVLRLPFRPDSLKHLTLHPGSVGLHFNQKMVTPSLGIASSGGAGICDEASECKGKNARETDDA